jgi:hypothetical protein
MLKFKDLMERLNVAKAKMGDVIKDFQDSDAPQFQGKSDEKRRQMAIAAKLEADRGVKEEVEELDENDALKRQIDFVKRDASDKGYSVARRKSAREKLKSLQSRLKTEDAEQTNEALKGNQHKIDANKNGKVDGHDFKILRNAKKARYQ